MSRIGKIVTMLALCILCVSTAAQAGRWQDRYKTITLGVITSENESDRLKRYDNVEKYLRKRLGVNIKWRTATDYAGIIQGVKAGKIQLAYFGPASYAECYIVTHGGIEPLVGVLDKDGNLGYHSVIIVRKNSRYRSVNDLKGVKFAFADPNSTSGNQAPHYFLRRQGIDADKFFGSCTFSGSHENSVMGLLHGTYDAVATWWRSASSNNFRRMALKHMIPAGQVRVIWKSPLLPSDPWTMPTNLPKQMREDVRRALLDMPKADPLAWRDWSAGEQLTGFRAVTAQQYMGIVHMVQANQRQRRRG